MVNRHNEGLNEGTHRRTQSDVSANLKKAFDTRDAHISTTRGTKFVYENTRRRKYNIIFSSNTF